MRKHWPLYLMEAAELAAFMLSACLFTVLLYHPASPALHWIPDATLRRACMGIAMGATAVAIIKSPWGKRSGAQFNPAITLTFLRLGKIGPVDAVCYIAAHFAGGILGVGLSAMLAGRALAVPEVNYAVTVPGPWGTGAAFAAELFMAALLMAVVLTTSNRPRLAPYTTYMVGTLIFGYILVFAPVSGFSINPARTVGSAIFAQLWTAVWIYFAAPVLGMLTSAELYLRLTEPRPRPYFTHRHLQQKPTV
ncbi:aquaporin Z [Granulicella rosea]|uniref:Aquaporin Z n=1 Tax=Granulicella rosea TaxID=474952 RepID=A0A239J6F4_9BACT|nr:aquaporin [Granulicella rosea]SNT01349.1 aquaporin Z [Granulicella rosea]